MKDNPNKRRKLTDEQVEQMLAKAVQKNVPDICQQAACTPVTPLAMVDDILPVQYPRRHPHRQRLAAACLMLLLTGAGIFGWLWFPTRAVVSIEVNPSVALSLNRFSYVVNTRANNDDGAELLDDLSLKNLKLDTALDALIGAMDRQGYLSQLAQVSVFVDGEDDDYNRRLYQQVTDSFSHLLPSQTAQEDTKEQEDTRQLLSEEQVKQICLSHAGVDAAQASFQSISLQQGEQPVYQLLFTAAGSSYSYRIDPYSGQVLSYERTEEAAAQQNAPPASAPSKPSSPSVQPQAEPKSLSLEQAKQLALQKAGLSGQTVVWEKAELDEEDGISYYELEFTFSQNEYECEVDAVSGSILKFEQD